MTVIYGLIGLSFIVFIHELGHFIAARICGVTVESFSIGMGPVLLHKKCGTTDYRLSLIPFGGYCGMKGEKSFQQAMEQKLEHIPYEEHGFYSVHPLKRAFIAFAGPLANFIFAVMCLSFIAAVGYDYYTSENKIITANEIYPESRSRAFEAGLQTGDRITAINGKKTAYFSDIAETVAVSPLQTLDISVERNGQPLNFDIEPELDKTSGAGKIGIISWTDPVISQIDEDSTAQKAGLQTGDRIIEAEGTAINNTAQLYKILKGLTSARIRYERSGSVYDAVLTVDTAEKSAKKISGAPLDGAAGILSGINWKAEKVHSKTYAFFPAIVQGIKETCRLFILTVKSISLLFRGVDVKQAVSGPIGVTVMLGQSAKEGFSAGFASGLVTLFNFLALINVSLFLMNLLPIPVLDGSTVFFALLEAVRGKNVKPATLYRAQFVGLAFIALIFAFGMFGDISRIIQNIKRG